MNIDINALGLLIISGLVALLVTLLLHRLGKVENSLDGLGTTLNRHGRKLVRIETKLGIYDYEHERDSGAGDQ